MKFASLAKSAVTAVALATAAFSASAAIYDLGALSAGAPKSFNAYTAGTGLESFDDSFKFTLAADGITSGSVIDFMITGLLGSEFSSAALYSGSPNAGVLVMNAIGDTDGYSFSNAVTPAGSYYFRVKGTVTPGVTLGAAYSGAISVTAPAPVPEPESYAMLLAGLGVMGAIALRRKSKPE